jgi:hypothetical protein
MAALALPAALSAPAVPRAPRRARPCAPRAAAASQQAKLAALESVRDTDQAPLDRLREWVEAHGGAVHPALRLADRASCGARGLVAAAPLPPDAPAIAVPEALLLTTDAGAERLGLPPAAAAGFDALPVELQLALLLATERARGEASFWAPFLATLPPRPPCAWAMPAAELDAALAGLGARATGGWRAAVADAARAVAVGVERALAAAAPRGGGALSAAELRWALGQVASRSYGGGDALAMLPVIDLANHRAGAPTPDGWHAPRGADCAALWPPGSGLAAGEELCVQYGAAGRARALNWVLSYGFVPPDVL